ncbi:MAG: tyrosine-type recombinase/integrase [bacterium]
MMNAIPRVSPPDLLPAVPVFIRRLHAPSTKQAYERELARWFAWLADNAPLDNEILPRYVEWLRARNLSATTISWRAVVVMQFLKDAHRQGVIDRDVTEGYRPPKGTRGFAPRVLSSGELKRLLRTPDRRSWRGRRDLAILTLLGIAGLRIGEVACLRICDVDLQSDRVVLKIRGKGNRIRSIALAGRNASPIRSWAKVRGVGQSDVAFFISKRVEDGEPRGMTIASIDYVVRRYGRVAGIDRLHAHLLRHCAASNALAGGMNLVAVRDLLGHSSIVTTSRYLHSTSGMAGVVVAG